MAADRSAQDETALDRLIDRIPALDFNGASARHYGVLRAACLNADATRWTA